jgi:8-oxo-dGTP pyrophosphatase MutT (NUDIX family)
MKKTSCGILILNAQGELLLCHATGTPIWDIPKGGAEPGESELETAIRETAEETGLRFVAEDLLDLGRFGYRPSKDLHLFATLADRFDPTTCSCTSHFRDYWGRLRPEMDDFAWTRFERVPQRCGRNMTALLTRTIRLDALLQRLQRAEAARQAPPSGRGAAAQPGKSASRRR